jgi:hypothetical protein
MLHVHRDPQQAREVGARAREEMERVYSLPAMGRRLVRELARIERKVLGDAAGQGGAGTGDEL